MKRLLLIVIIAIFMTPVALIAQEVYKASNRVILDLTVAAGMPAGAVTDVPKVWNRELSNDGWSYENLTGSHINATLYQKLEIAPNDLTATTEEGVTTYYVDGGGSISTFAWLDAYNGCKSVGDGDWRLPTLRELQYIYIFKPALDDILGEVVGGVALTDDNKWSVTEDSNYGYSYYVVFGSGSTSNIDKATTYSVRCVREIQ